MEKMFCVLIMFGLVSFKIENKTADMLRTWKKIEEQSSAYLTSVKLAGHHPAPPLQVSLGKLAGHSAVQSALGVIGMLPTSAVLVTIIKVYEMTELG